MTVIGRTRATTAYALALALLAVPLTPGRAEAAAPQNSCAHPHWADTLRCLFAPGELPQPNLASKPDAVGALRAYTRVFPRTPAGVRALDGTMPLIYVDKAVCTRATGCNKIAFGAPVPSPNWVISFTGGGSCSATDTDGDTVMDDATECLEAYGSAAERSEMGSASDPPMRTLGGINDPDPTLNPIFAGYNRVRIEKVAYDRHLGRVAYSAPGGYFAGVVPAGSSAAQVRFDLFQQGALIAEAVLRALASGLRYKTWVDDDGQVKTVTETLPSLRKARTVLFVGESGGAHGLHHNVDRFATLLSALGSSADVRVLLDANFTSSMENEAAFASPLPGADVYSDIWSGTSTAGGETFTYSGEDYWTVDHADGNQGLAEQYASWSVRFDQSCLDAHAGAGDDWKCKDRRHVLMNHLDTPFFVREDLNDPNKEHTANGTGHLPTWADFGNFAACPAPGPFCPPTFTLAEHHARIVEQARALIEESSAASEMAVGADTSLGGEGAFPTFVVWMPDCRDHVTVSNDKFFDTSMRYLASHVSMREMAERFVRASRTGGREWRIDGWQDGAGHPMTTASC